MTIWTSTSPRWCNYASHTVGAIPSSAVIGAAHASLLYHVNFARSGQLMSYIGGYKAAVFGGDVSTDNYFHVAFPATAHPNASGDLAKKRYFAIMFNAFPDAASTSVTVQINDDGGAAVATLLGDTGATNSMQKGPDGISWQYVWSQDYDAANSDCVTTPPTGVTYGYNVFTVRISGVHIGSFSAFEVTPNQATMSLCTGRDYNIHPTVLGGGMAVRGCDNPAAAPYSVGTMLQNQMSSDATYDSLVGSSRRCLFSLCHPQGRYAIGAGVIGWDYLITDEAGNNVKFTLWPRQLTDVNPQDVDIVVVARSDADTKLLVWFDNLDSGKEIDLEASSDAKLYVSHWDDCIAAVSSELVHFQAYVSNAKAVEVKTIQIWERETVVR
jgi:hypothetical protein